MPYIPNTERNEIDPNIRRLLDSMDYNPGTLNYVITKLIVDYVQMCGERYGTYNSAIGVLECAKLELYRRMVAPYEDKKKAENGEVYE